MASAALTIPSPRPALPIRDDTVAEQASRLVAGGAALLASSVLADSTIEHYRGSFQNPAMVLPLASSAVSLAISGRRAAGSGFGRSAGAIGHVAAGAIGAAGIAFHIYNIGKQPGGYRLNNFFYKAPLGAPGALVLTGILGAAADRLAGSGRPAAGSLLRSPGTIGVTTALGLTGTVAEVAFLHFRGAYHNPAMWLPITVAPLTAISLARDVLRAVPSRVTAFLLAATATLGLAGSLFHAYGVSRNMGGWRNWRQNLLAGPPLPAPPSFTGLALAGLGALVLLREARRV